MHFLTVLATFLAASGTSLALPMESDKSSLNLHSAVHQLQARQGSTLCQPLGSSDLRAAYRKDVESIATFLIALNEQNVVVTKGAYKKIGYAGQSVVYGRAKDADTATSFARDVGYGVRGLLQLCQGDYWIADGFAGGNGNFEIVATNQAL